MAISYILISSATGTAGTSTYIYDEQNRLMKVTQTDTYSIEYSYDPVGNRTLKAIQAMLPSFDIDTDGDVDGQDLSGFFGSWNGSPAMLAEFAQAFGSSSY